MHSVSCTSNMLVKRSITTIKEHFHSLFYWLEVNFLVNKVNQTRQNKQLDNVNQEKEAYVYRSSNIFKYLETCTYTHASKRKTVTSLNLSMIHACEPNLRFSQVFRDTKSIEKQKDTFQLSNCGQTRDTC